MPSDTLAESRSAFAVDVAPIADSPSPARFAPRSASRAGSRALWMVLREGPFWERGRILELPALLNEGTLGRSLTCQWRINDPSVSRLHAALVRKPRRGVYLLDLASREGTFVNGERVIEEVLLMDGDRIGLGSRVVLEFVDGPPPNEASERRWVRRFSLLAMALAFLTLLTFVIF